jgi:isocitrate/isopropylmalate dehydrogenase
MAPSGDIGDDCAVFQPSHGTAPDIAGKGIANPYGTIWSGALMLEHLGELQAARQIVKSMDKATAEGVLSADLGGKTKTAEIARRVAETLDIA